MKRTEATPVESVTRRDGSFAVRAGSEELTAPQLVIATLKATARFLDVSTGQEVWSTPVHGTAKGTDLMTDSPGTMEPKLTA